MNKIVKVTIEFEDGDIHSLEGEEAQKWDEACASLASLGFAHGMMFPEFDWKEEKKNDQE